MNAVHAVRHLEVLGLALATWLALAACGGQSTSAGHDGGADARPRDLGAADGQADASPPADGGTDSTTGVDSASDAATDAGADAAGDAGGGDAAGDAGSDATADAAPPEDAPHDSAPPQDAQHDTAPPQQDAGPAHVDIYISNTCVVTVVPASITVPAGSSLMLDFHNNSQWYSADIWWSWTGGYLDLATGAIWHDPIPACSMSSVHDEYADISIAGGPTSGCPGFRLWVHCV
jgi:hypothetical protein